MDDDGFVIDESDPRNIRTREMLAAIDRMIPSPIEGVTAEGMVSDLGERWRFGWSEGRGESVARVWAIRKGHRLRIRQPDGTFADFMVTDVVRDDRSDGGATLTLGPVADD